MRKRPSRVSRANSAGGISCDKNGRRAFPVISRWIQSTQNLLSTTRLSMRYGLMELIFCKFETRPSKFKCSWYKKDRAWRYYFQTWTRITTAILNCWMTKQEYSFCLTMRSRILKPISSEYVISKQVSTCLDVTHLWDDKVAFHQLQFKVSPHLFPDP